MPPRSGRSKFPWLVLLLLAGSIYVFWVLPRQFPPKPIEVIFEDGTKNAQTRTPQRRNAGADRP